MEFFLWGGNLGVMQEVKFEDRNMLETLVNVGES